ncbi:aqualysin-1-like [Amphiura filiformis]|uniref:aqualysin-1-like n=1 Tax=Amphiura filiformis TaxID=82378 RepID=UPI003B20BC58
MKLLVVILLCSPLMVFGSYLSPYYKSTERIPGQFIVKIKDGINLDDFVSYFETNSVGHVYRKYDSVLHGVSVRLHDSLVQWLRGLDAVDYVEEDSVARLDAVASWGLDRVDQRDRPLDDNYNPTRTGSGANVYVIDTGIRHTHTDYAGRAFSFFDYEGGDGNDCHGHGTHCTGTILGTTYGIAKQANAYSVRVMSCSGSGSYSNIIAGLNAVAGDTRGSRVASMSIGGGKSTSLNDAVKDAFNQGVVVSVSAGNDNADACNKSPASAPEAITVGATTSTDARSSFSNYGTCVDIFAPGSSITSSCYGSDFQSCSKSGTSMSCPHVAGAAALVRGDNASATPQDVTDEILNNATPNKVTDAQTDPNLLLYVN